MPSSRVHEAGASESPWNLDGHGAGPAQDGVNDAHDGHAEPSEDASRNAPNHGSRGSAADDGLGEIPDAAPRHDAPTGNAPGGDPPEENPSNNDPHDNSPMDCDSETDSSEDEPNHQDSGDAQTPATAEYNKEAGH